MKLKYKIVFTIAGLLAIASWLIAINFWDILPSVIPTHFGIDGLADDWSNKTFLSVFLLPIVQVLMLGLFIFIYYKPQYSNIPSTMWLMILDKKQKDRAYDLMRTMHAGIILAISMLFTYMTYAMNMSAIYEDYALSGVIMFGVIGLILAWTIGWTVVIYRISKNLSNNKLSRLVI